MLRSHATSEARHEGVVGERKRPVRLWGQDRQPVHHQGDLPRLERPTVTEPELPRSAGGLDAIAQRRTDHQLVRQDDIHNVAALA
jgi:hypothetical protein